MMQKQTEGTAMDFDTSTLKFNEAGLIPAIAQDATTGEVLMMAWMNAQAVTQTLETGRVTYWSRSRQSFWIKGDTSGHVQELVELRIDCDRDCLLVKVHQTGRPVTQDGEAAFTRWSRMAPNASRLT